MPIKVLKIQKKHLDPNNKNQKETTEFVAKEIAKLLDLKNFHERESEHYSLEGIYFFGKGKDYEIKIYASDEVNNSFPFVISVKVDLGYNNIEEAVNDVKNKLKDYFILENKNS